VKLRRGAARASMVMDHGRFGPRGALGGADGGINVVHAQLGGVDYVPPHLSKDQDIPLGTGDSVTVSTPGGGGYGPPLARDPLDVARDVRRGYYSVAEVEQRFGVVLDTHGKVNVAATERVRSSALQALEECHRIEATGG